MKQIVLLLLLIGTLQFISAIHPLSVVEVDFDAEPETRWIGALDAVMSRYGWKKSFEPLFKHHNKTDMKHLTHKMYARIAAAVEKNWPIYARELKGLADHFKNTWNIKDVTYEYLAAWVYYHEIGHAKFKKTFLRSDGQSQNEEIFEVEDLQKEDLYDRTQVYSKECTGVLVQALDGTVLQGRNLDQNVPSIRHIALHMHIKKNGVRIGEAVDFYWFNAGFVTAFIPGVVSMQSNWRLGDLPIDQILEHIEAGYTPHVWFFREAILGGKLQNYNDYVNFFMSSKPIAPIFIILAGVSKGQGAIVTLDTEKQIPLISLAQQMDDSSVIPERVLLVQTNKDHWEKPDLRRRIAEKLLNNFEWELMSTPLGLFGVMDTYSIHNQETMYTVIMNAGKGFIQSFGQEKISPE